MVEFVKEYLEKPAEDIKNIRSSMSSVISIFVKTAKEIKQDLKEIYDGSITDIFNKADD